ncbi:hypothetical protein [Robertmurraya kyonggiensis]|uniref:Uncharacterized protein n=1 Tax=Robertmurraya kyonggiensis TaxID=1037680 RepID=A0A4U1D6J2_9BACI|nr:hypothetical protein [Robertmurraya kyonggiensis]TKC18121.1 hypothetical protein FA727_00755 [Robertmurraya kyonggiensis]
MGKRKQFLILIAVIGQILGIILLFVHMTAAIVSFIIYGLACATLFILLIVERMKEKEEENEHDYRDY